MPKSVHARVIRTVEEQLILVLGSTIEDFPKRSAWRPWTDWCRIQRENRVNEDLRHGYKILQQQFTESLAGRREITDRLSSMPNLDSVDVVKKREAIERIQSLPSVVPPFPLGDLSAALAFNGGRLRTQIPCCKCRALRLSSPNTLGEKDLSEDLKDRYFQKVFPGDYPCAEFVTHSQISTIARRGWRFWPLPI